MTLQKRVYSPYQTGLAVEWRRQVLQGDLEAQLDLGIVHPHVQEAVTNVEEYPMAENARATDVRKAGLFVGCHFVKWQARLEDGALLARQNRGRAGIPVLGISVLGRSGISGTGSGHGGSIGF